MECLLAGGGEMNITDRFKTLVKERDYHDSTDVKSKGKKLKIRNLNALNRRDNQRVNLLQIIYRGPYVMS